MTTVKPSLFALMNVFKWSEHKAKKDEFWEGKWEGLSLWRQRAGKEVVQREDRQPGMGSVYTIGLKCRSRGKTEKGKKYTLSPAQGKYSVNPQTAEEVIHTWAASRKPKQGVRFGALGRWVSLGKDPQLRSRKGSENPHWEQPSTVNRPAKIEATLLQTLSTKKPVKRKMGNDRRVKAMTFLYLAWGRVAYRSEDAVTSKTLRACLSFSVLCSRI